MSGDELPKGWTSSVIDQLCHRVTDGTHFSPKEQNRRGGYKYVTAKNIREWGLDLSDLTYVSEAIHRPIFQRCNPEKDDVLYIKDGATAGIAILNPLEEEFSLLSSVALLKPDRSQLDPSFLKWYLMSPVGRKAMLDQVTGSAITRLTLEIIRKSVIPAPPLPEQKRIVAKLEGLLVRANAARERLARVPAILKRFRQAVLAAACEGRLTDANPEEWHEATLEEVGKWFTGGTPSRKVAINFGGGIPWVKSGELRDGLVTETSETLSRTGVANSAAKLMPKGTVSVALYGATIGKVGVLGMEATTNQACANCVVNDRVIDRWFLFYFLTQQRDQLVEAGQGGAQPNLTNQIVRSWPLRLPPIPEQREIVRRVVVLFKLADAVERRVAAATARAEKLTQAILAKAFRGELVPTEAELG